MPVLNTVTLGCKVNQYESEYVRQALAPLGYRAPQGDEAVDLYIFNTCTVTADAEAQCRKMIRRAARRDPHAQIIVLGCFPARAPHEAAALPGVVEIVPDKRRLPDLLLRLGVAEIPAGISTFSNRRRAYVKIQDGCRMPCSYCIVPQVRPVLCSRAPQEVVDEVGRLIESGHQEIILTGIHLGHYGADASGSTSSNGALPSLLERLLCLPGRFRVRLSSIEASEVSDPLLALMREHPQRLCPHLHLPLQSGSDSVLQRMRRRQTYGQYAARCAAIREQLDQPALSTDIIVGFPGETDADFAATCRVVEELGFAQVHIFRYSPREGTPAATLPDQVLDRLKLERWRHVQQLAGDMGRRYRERLVGRRMQVLVESVVADGIVEGTSERYLAVRLPGDARWIGRMVDAVATGVGEDHMLGSPAEAGTGN
jgi:threonylcarbamoyladenosine tRNA methylthiotransferase MtaB